MGAVRVLYAKACATRGKRHRRDRCAPQLHGSSIACLRDTSVNLSKEMSVMEKQTAGCGHCALRWRGSERVVPDTVHISDNSTEVRGSPRARETAYTADHTTDDTVVAAGAAPRHVGFNVPRKAGWGAVRPESLVYLSFAITRNVRNDAIRALGHGSGTARISTLRSSHRERLHSALQGACARAPRHVEESAD